MQTHPRRTLLLWLTSLLVAGAAYLSVTSTGSAASAPPPGPDRFKSVVVKYTSYTWFMVAYRKNDIVCKIVVDYEGKPDLKDVYIDCGDALTNEWVAQPPCMNYDRPNNCKGYYIYLVSAESKQKDVAVELPPPVVWLDVSGCSPVTSLSTSICEYIPKLKLTAQEPLPGYEVSSIEGRLNGQGFSCPGDTCELDLQPTPPKGVLLEFWANSTYGDSSKKFTAQTRVTEASLGNPDAPAWFVDVRSSQWTGVPSASCADTWQVFPPIGGTPQWLSTPSDASGLASSVPYNYLAANLIRRGLADVSACDDRGLLPDRRSASACGLDAAQGAVTAWQNRFDDLILQVARQTGVPAQMLKNLFARESQFWPGMVLPDGDTGLGQLTQNGADTALLWNPSFYQSFCPLVLSQQTCEEDYMSLEPEVQELLQQALVNSVDATCADCPLGIDLDRANYSVTVFAHTLMANCQQASQVIWNYSGRKMPDQLDITFEDMWKFTLVNYNAGGGCLADALQQTVDKKVALTWENVSQYLAPACRSAIRYVNDISQ